MRQERSPVAYVRCTMCAHAAAAAMLHNCVKHMHQMQYGCASRHHADEHHTYAMHSVHAATSTSQRRDGQSKHSAVAGASGKVQAVRQHMSHSKSMASKKGAGPCQLSKRQRNNNCVPGSRA